jgi:hypothetical protein
MYGDALILISTPIGHGPGSNGPHGPPVGVYLSAVTGICEGVWTRVPRFRTVPKKVVPVAKRNVPPRFPGLRVRCAMSFPKQYTSVVMAGPVGVKVIASWP